MNSATTAAKPQGLRSGALLSLGPTLLQQVPALPPSHTALPLLLACLVGHFGLPGFDFHFISLNSPLVPAPLDREPALIYSHQQQKKSSAPGGQLFRRGSESREGIPSRSMGIWAGQSQHGPNTRAHGGPGLPPAVQRPTCGNTETTDPSISFLLPSVQ